MASVPLKLFCLRQSGAFFAHFSRGLHGSSAGAASSLDQQRRETVTQELVPTSTAFSRAIHRAIDADGSGRAERSPGIESTALSDVAKYYFDGRGKGVRPRLAFLMSRAVNAHLGIDEGDPEFDELLTSQNTIALASEMIHTYSLLHDDVLDTADLRRGRPSVNASFGERDSVFAGAYGIIFAYEMVSRLRDAEVLSLLGQVMDSLVTGELQQSKRSLKTEAEERVENSSIIDRADVDLFLENYNNSHSCASCANRDCGSPSPSVDLPLLSQHYLLKTYNKTASLMALTCKAVAVLAAKKKSPENQALKESVSESAFAFGKDLGLCFQLVDDALDFEAEGAEDIGKPVAADLK